MSILAENEWYAAKITLNENTYHLDGCYILNKFVDFGEKKSLQSNLSTLGYREKTLHEIEW